HNWGSRFCPHWASPLGAPDRNNGVRGALPRGVSLARGSVMRIVTWLACCILLVFATKTADAEARQYIWSDIDCRQSRIAAWPGLKCRATNVVKSEGNIGVFRQWAAFGTSRDGYYAHMFLWEGPEQFLLSFRRGDDGRLRERDIRVR